MPKKATYTSALQDIVRQYREAGQPWPTDKRTIAAWAYNEGLWKPQRSSAIDELAKAIGRAMGVEYMTDPQGRRIRSKHARRVETENEFGEMIQTTIWDDITTAPPEHMQVSFQQRRTMMLSDNHQHKTDVDSYNQNWNPGEALEFSYDYTEDLLEMEQPTEYPTRKEDDDGEDGGAPVPA